MIGERYAAVPRPTSARRIRARDRGIFGKLRQGGSPAVAGRQRVAEALGQSLVVQLMLVMSLLVFAALVYLNQASKVSVLHYNLTTLRQDALILQQQNAQFHAASTWLTAPGRIEAAATRLHMTKADPKNTIWVTVVVPQVPQIKPVTADIVQAQEVSSPRAWLSRAAHSFLSSL